MKILAKIMVLMMMSQVIKSQTVIYYVAAQKADCTGAVPMKCLQIKKSPDAPYTLFYRQIEGFAYEEGYEYKIKLQVTPIANPPADASSVSYKLLEVMEKSKVNPSSTDKALLGEWKLVKILKGTKLSKQASSNAFVNYTADGHVNGNNSCNSYFGTYKQSDKAIKFSEMASTKMYCEGSIELEFMTHLEKANRYKLGKKYMYLYEGNKVLMQFSKK